MKVLLACLAAIAAIAATEAAADNAVTRSQAVALQAVRDNNVSTPAAGRLYAMTAVAMYDAVNGIDSISSLGGREPALIPVNGAPKFADRGLAAAAAANAVLRGLLPSSYHATLQQALDEEIARVRSPRTGVPLADGVHDEASARGDPHDRIERALDWGRGVGEQVLALRAADGTQTALSIPGGSEPGRFRAAFSPAQYKDMAPFGVADPTRFSQGSPPPLTSNDYAAAWHEVRLLGSSEDTDEERREIRVFWQAEARTVRETGIWLLAALAVVEQEGTTRSLSDTARLFALLGMGIADAVRVTWADKAANLRWRPTDAIRNADEDGNPDTVSDAGWTSAVGSVGSTPEFTSGTSTFAGAASRILSGFYCRDDVAFTFRTDLALHDRSYARFSQAAVEAGRSRIFQGIHFQYSNLAGLEAGRQIGAEIVTQRLRRAGDKAPLTGICP